MSRGMLALLAAALVAIAVGVPTLAGESLPRRGQ